MGGGLEIALVEGGAGIFVAAVGEIVAGGADGRGWRHGLWMRESGKAVIVSITLCSSPRHPRPCPGDLCLCLPSPLILRSRRGLRLEGGSREHWSLLRDGRLRDLLRMR